MDRMSKILKWFFILGGTLIFLFILIFASSIFRDYYISNYGHKSHTSNISTHVEDNIIVNNDKNLTVMRNNTVYGKINYTYEIHKPLLFHTDFGTFVCGMRYDYTGIKDSKLLTEVECVNSKIFPKTLLELIKNTKIESVTIKQCFNCTYRYPEIVKFNFYQSVENNTSVKTK